MANKTKYVDVEFNGDDLVDVLTELRDEVKAFRDHANLVSAGRITSIAVEIDPPHAKLTRFVEADD